MQRGCGLKVARYYTVLLNSFARIIPFTTVSIQRQLVAKNCHGSNKRQFLPETP
jgi:hypothetical protein